MVSSFPSSEWEDRFREEGYKRIAGVDEAGRGPLAGPVVAAACWMDPKLKFAGVNDSKKLTEAKRERLYEEITSHPEVVWSVGVVGQLTIDAINIYQATLQAMIKAVDSLILAPDFLLVDGLKLPHPTLPSHKLIHGDALSHIIASASILAKVTRDRLMKEYDLLYPEYGFKSHKGYGTKAHLKAISLHGISPLHRKSFAPCSK